MKAISTIQKFNGYIDSGSRPAIALCDDFNEWYIKYDDRSALFNEILGNKLMADFGCNVPNIALVKVDKEHLVKATHFGPSSFSSLCFGSQKIQSSVEVSSLMNSFTKDSSTLKKISNPEDILRIGLLDLWLGNEDRHAGNPNILLEQSNGENRLIPIDHTHLFNTNSWHFEPCILTQEESILQCNLLRVLFLRKVGKRDIVESIIKEFYLCMPIFSETCRNIFPEVPVEWNYQKEQKLEYLDHLFTENWLKLVTQTFQEYVTLTLDNK